MPAASLGGTTIAWSVRAPVRDALGELLAMLGPSVDDPTEPGPRGIVRFALRPAPKSAARDPRGEGWRPSFFHGAVATFQGTGGFLVWDGASRVLIPQERGVIDAAIAPAEDEETPGTASTALQIALILALRGSGMFHLHAAGLVLPSGDSVLVVGASGAGKTTTVLSLLEAAPPGARYLGDDSLYVAPGPEGLKLVAFPREFHVGAKTLAAFPRLAGLAGPEKAWADKCALDPRRAYPGQFVGATPIARGHALALFPSITAAATTSVAPLARAEAFGYLLASSGAVLVDGAPGRDENLAALQELLEAADCYQVRLGADALARPHENVAAVVAGLRTKPRVESDHGCGL